MAVTTAIELQPVDAVTSRLQTLLDHATAIRPQNVTAQPLPMDELLNEIDALYNEIPERYDQGYKFAIVENAARELFYTWIGELTLDDPTFANVWNLLDVLMYAGDRDICAPDLVCLLIEELMDSLTTTDCRTVMDYLESRRETLAKKDFHKKNLVLLRACNELLRRLSRAEDAIFCGRVFFFLFLAFPLGDRSSVNLRGEFHTENTTKFEVFESQSPQDGEKMDVDAQPAKTEEEMPKPATPTPLGKPGSKAVPIKQPPKKEPEEAPVLSNSSLYPIFWRLQQDFSDPTRLFASAELQRFKAGVDSTVAKFRKTPVVQATTTEDIKRGTKRKLEGTSGTTLENEPSESTNTYNPKYLTSRELFDLELSDLAFQRHILVQALILMDFLLSLTEKARKKSDMLGASNKALSFKDFILSDKDAAWATETRSTINAYLSVSQEGRLFQRMVETVLARDKNWVRWKLDGCPSIVREPASTESELEAREGVKKATKPRHVPDRPKTAMNLSFLDESSGAGLELLKDSSRYTVWSIDQLAEGIKNDELDLEMAMTDEEKEGLENAMANKRWRLLRQARGSRLGLLDRIEPGKDLDAVFRPPPEQEAPDAAIETVGEAPTADEGVNGGPDVVVTAEHDDENGNHADDSVTAEEPPTQPAADA